MENPVVKRGRGRPKKVIQELEEPKSEVVENDPKLLQFVATVLNINTSLIDRINHKLGDLKS